IWTYSPQKRQAGSAFALRYILLLRSCTLMDAFIISSVPPVLIEELPTAGFLRSTGVTPPPSYYEPLRHPLIVGRFPGSTGYTAYPASAVFTTGRGGLLQLLDASLSPCCRYHPAGAARRFSQRATFCVAFTP